MVLPLKANPLVALLPCSTINSVVPCSETRENSKINVLTLANNNDLDVRISSFSFEAFFFSIVLLWDRRLVVEDSRRFDDFISFHLPAKLSHVSSMSGASCDILSLSADAPSFRVARTGLHRRIRWRVCTPSNTTANLASHCPTKLVIIATL